MRVNLAATHSVSAFVRARYPAFEPGFKIHNERFFISRSVSSSPSGCEVRHDRADAGLGLVLVHRDREGFAFSRARSQTDEFERIFWSGQSLDELYQAVSQKPASAMQALFVAAMREWRRSIEGTAKPLAGVQMRIERVMDVTIMREMERLERRLLFLATVGAVAPFIGLFGTVWGIMTAFRESRRARTPTWRWSPGIAEALFATALGLLAAIPAVIFYNAFTRSASRISQRLEAFSDEFSAIVSRQLDLKA